MSKNLRRTRGLLLPRPLSGQIKVAAARGHVTIPTNL